MAEMKRVYIYIGRSGKLTLKVVPYPIDSEASGIIITHEPGGLPIRIRRTNLGKIPCSVKAPALDCEFHVWIYGGDEGDLRRAKLTVIEAMAKHLCALDIQIKKASLALTNERLAIDFDANERIAVGLDQGE